MDKLNMQTPNILSENENKLLNFVKSTFPNCIKEGKDKDGNVIEKIDFDLLKTEIGNISVEGLEERYRLDWPGKQRSILKANTPITKTLRPVKEASLDWDNTQNLYIEGDNFEVLKILQEAYLGRVKMIYIDPPYNTGKDFIYSDNFSEDLEDYRDKTEKDGEGYIMMKNTETNGRFHSDWLSMMYERLKVARDLLTNDGVIFISISDAEFDNLKKICDEIFGENNYCGDIIWNSTKSVTNTALISVSHTYNLIYFKNIEYFIENRSEFRIPDEGEGFENPDNDPRGPWKADPFQVGGRRPNQQYEIVNPKTGVVYKPNEGCSRKNDYNKYQELLKDNRIVFGKTGDSGPQRKRFMYEAMERGKVVKTIRDDTETTTNGTMLLKKLFDNVSIFDNPKPVGFIKRILQLGSKRDSIILDFFSGSGTTAHTVMQLNAEDGGNRKYIMVQLPELCDEDSQAYKAGYKTITEIGKERIRRAGKKIKEETNADIDYGFRVYRVDESCMKDIYYNPSEAKQEDLGLFVSNIKDDRTSEDLLTQVILNLGLTLDLPIEEKKIGNNKVFYVAGNSLVACFDENIDFDIIEEIAKDQPLKMVLRDSSFRSDADRINFENTMKELSKDTIIKVI